MADDYWNFRRAPRPSDYGYTELGNIDLGHRPVVRNPDGSISTVRSMSANLDGSEVLMPTVSPDGRIWNDQEAIDNYLATGQHLGKFLTPEDATAAAQSIHEDQATTYSGSAPTRPYNRAGPGQPIPAYDDWNLIHRGAMAPWGVYENQSGDTASGFAWPSMITEPLAAGERLFKPGGTFESNPTPESALDMGTVLMSILGNNALNPATALPKNALGMFAGRKAATADHQALALAERLAAEGADRNAIWNQTGWFQGPDKQWRFEIDDSKARVNNLEDMVPDAYSSLDYVLAHPELSKSYPSMMDNTSLTADAFPSPYQNAGAAHVTDLDTIMLNSGRDDWKDKALTNLLHETQHQIQKNEGFYGGGAKSQIPTDLIAQERARIISTPDENSWSVFDNTPGDMTDDQIAWSIYRRLPGEVEARNVQRRANMDAGTRKAFPPWETQDIPYEDQIVRLLSDTGRPSRLGSALAGAQGERNWWEK